MEHTNSLPFVVWLDDGDAPGDVIDTLALEQFVAGAQPWARTKGLERVRPDATLLPPLTVPIREARERGIVVRLAVGDGWTLRARRWADGSGYVTVTAETAELAEHVLELAIDGATEPPATDAGLVSIGFWNRSGRGAHRVAREIDAPAWETIRANYTAPVADGFDTLMALTPDHLSGRLALLHGPPGTGKTTALRALARAWRPWCTVDCVLDPEQLLRDVGYLMEVVLGDGDRAKDRWRLLLLEDCDELIRNDAKAGSGQALARLLNLTDGLVGQGLDVLVCITTNEELHRLHPAVTRPGRCLAQVHVGPLTPAEATTWLGRPVAAATTLAELCSLRDESDAVRRARPDEPVGQYL